MRIYGHCSQKPKESWGSQSPVTWVCPGPVHVFTTQMRGPLQMTQRKAGNRTRRCSGSRTIEKWTQGPSIVIPLIHHFSPEEKRRHLRKGRVSYYVSCVRFIYLVFKGGGGRSYSASGIQPVTFLFWNITCGTTINQTIMDATLKAAQASVKEMIYEISLILNIYDAVFGKG